MFRLVFTLAKLSLRSNIKWIPIFGQILILLVLKFFSSLVWIYCFGKNDTELKYNTNISNLLTATTSQYGFFFQVHNKQTVNFLRMITLTGNLANSGQITLITHTCICTYISYLSSLYIVYTRFFFTILLIFK